MGEAIQSSGLVCGPWYDLMNTYGAGLPAGRGAEEDQTAYGLNGVLGGRILSIACLQKITLTWCMLATDAVHTTTGTYETREVQVEYFVPLANAEVALQICSDVCGKWSYDVFLITELRAVSEYLVAADFMMAICSVPPTDSIQLLQSL